MPIKLNDIKHDLLRDLIAVNCDICQVSDTCTKIAKLVNVKNGTNTLAGRCENFVGRLTEVDT